MQKNALFFIFLSKTNFFYLSVVYFASKNFVSLYCIWSSEKRRNLYNEENIIFIK